MSRLQELINELCPNGVGYKFLWEVTAWDKRFKGIDKKKQIKLNSFKHVSSKKLKSLNTNGPVKLVSTGKFEGSTNIEQAREYLNYGEVILIPSGGNANVKYYNGEFVDSGNIIATALNINCKFLYYVLQSRLTEISSFYRGAGIQHPDMAMILETKIPVPPLPVQEEIVRILDKMTDYVTELKTELKAELKARKKQYEYYKLLLLSVGDKVKLKEVAEYSKGRIFASDLNATNYVGVDNLLQNRMGKTNATYIPLKGKCTEFLPNDILIGNIRPYLKKIWFSDIRGGTNGDVLTIHIVSNKIVPKFLYYLLSSDAFFHYDNNNSKGAKMPRGNKDLVMEYSFNLPSVIEQRKIVSILDKFDILNNSISEGLPAEIEARQKQYEYYRDKLLNFKEIAVEE